MSSSLSHTPVLQGFSGDPDFLGSDYTGVTGKKEFLLCVPNKSATAAFVSKLYSPSPWATLPGQKERSSEKAGEHLCHAGPLLPLHVVSFKLMSESEKPLNKASSLAQLSVFSIPASHHLSVCPACGSVDGVRQVAALRSSRCTASSACCFWLVCARHLSHARLAPGDAKVKKTSLPSRNSHLKFTQEKG